MSARLFDAVLEHDMSAPQKAVLGFLCWKANDHGGDCFPAIPTIVKATSQGKRTVQRALIDLEAAGWLRSVYREGVGKRYELNAARIMEGKGCQSGTSAGAAPVPERRKGGVRAAPNRQEKDDSTQPARAKPKNTGPLPDGWQPEAFGPDTKSARIIAGWDDERCLLEIEKFRAYHGTRDNRFSSWQQAWATWVLNTRSYHNGGTNGRSERATPRDTRDGFDRAVDRSLGLAGSDGRTEAGPHEAARPAGRPAALPSASDRGGTAPRLRVV